MSYQPNEAITFHAEVGTTGKVDGDFTKALFHNGAVSGTVTIGTITEIGSTGIYKASFTPDAEGTWDPMLTVSGDRYSQNAPFTVQNPNDYKADVSALALEASVQGLNDIAVADILAGVVESNASVTLKQALSVILAAAAGKTEAGQTIFKDPSGTDTRITATLSTTDRTSIVLNPSS